MEEWPWTAAGKDRWFFAPSIIDAGFSSSVLGEEHRTLNPGPPAFQCPDSITVRVLHRDLCAQPCARRGSIKPASGRRL